MRIRKDKWKEISECVCGKSSDREELNFSAFVLRLLLLVFIIVGVVSGAYLGEPLNSDALVSLFVAGVFVVAFLSAIIIKSLGGHTLKCSLRWSFFAIF